MQRLYKKNSTSQLQSPELDHKQSPQLDHKQSPQLDHIAQSVQQSEKFLDLGTLTVTWRGAEYECSGVCMLFRGTSKWVRVGPTFGSMRAWQPKCGCRETALRLAETLERFRDRQTTNTNTCGWAVFLHVDFRFRDGHTDKTTNTNTTSSAGWNCADRGHSRSRGYTAVLYVCAGSQP